MQAIEVEAEIAENGSIHLPECYKAYFGKHAKLIILLSEVKTEEKLCYPLHGLPLHYAEATQPVAVDDWDVIT